MPDVIIPECKRKKKPAEVAAEEEEEEEDDIEAEPSGTPSEEDESAVKGQILWLRGLNRLQTQVCRLLKAVSISLKALEVLGVETVVIKVTRGGVLCPMEDRASLQ